MATLSRQVSATNDDWFENGSGTITLNGASAVFNASTYWLAFRFLNIALAAGDTVNTAVLSIYITSTTRDDPDFDCYGEDVDNAATGSSTTSDISSRARTTAVTNKNGTGVGVGFYAIDVKAQVDEIKARGGWASGNAMNFILDALAACNLGINMYDGTPANAATLEIDYTPAASAAGPLLGGKLTHSVLQGRLVC